MKIPAGWRITTGTNIPARQARENLRYVLMRTALDAGFSEQTRIGVTLLAKHAGIYPGTLFAAMNVGVCSQTLASRLVSAYPFLRMSWLLAPGDLEFEEDTGGDL